jgi:hypothetical protein
MGLRASPPNFALIEKVGSHESITLYLTTLLQPLLKNFPCA